MITPNHGAIWLAPGVLGDAGSTPAGERVLTSLRGANFNTTNDQPLVIPANFVAFMVTRIIITMRRSA